jgi:transcriptional regulator with XRE-family HTH domain
MAGMTKADEARLRIREEMIRKGLNQRDLADQLQWSQSKLGKILNGRTTLAVDDMAEICYMIGLRPAEAVRDHGFEFVADMTATELRLHQRLKLHPKAGDLIMALLDSRTLAPSHSRASPTPRQKTKEGTATEHRRKHKKEPGGA